MHSGKKLRCILVKSDEFENLYSLLYILFKSWLRCCSLATLAPQQSTLKPLHGPCPSILRSFLFPICPWKTERFSARRALFFLIKSFCGLRVQLWRIRMLFDVCLINFVVIFLSQLNIPRVCLTNAPMASQPLSVFGCVVKAKSFWKQHDNHVIFLPEFSLNTNPKLKVAFSNFSGVVWTDNIWCLSEWKRRFQISPA